MNFFKKRAKSYSTFAKPLQRVWVFEQLEARAMSQAGVSVVAGWELQLWWSGYTGGYTALQRERVGSNEWVTLLTNPNGTGSYDDINPTTDPNAGVSPGLTYSYRLVSSTGTVDLGTYTTDRYGDANSDGTVDDTDFNTWLDGVFNGGSTWQEGDFSNDGTVDTGDDWNILLSVYGDPTQAPTTSVHGAAGTSTGTPYTLDFNYDANIDPADYWVINWGDGSDPQLLPGDARSAQHNFSSAGDFNIQVGVAAAGSRDMTGGTFSAGSHIVHVQAAAAAPSGTTVTGTTQSSASVAWTNNASGATGVIVNVTQNGTPFNSYTLPPTQSSFTLNGLNQNTTYGFSVAAQNYAGTSAATAEVSVQTNPAAPSSVTATPDGNGHLVVHWTDNTGGVVGHVVSGDNGFGVSTTLATLAAGVSTATINAPPAGSTVPITVSAQRSSSSPSSSSAAATATVADQPTPFGVASGSWNYSGANPSHLQNNTVTGNFSGIPTHNNLTIQWEPLDVEPGFTPGDTATRTISLGVDGSNAGTVSYVFDSFDSSGVEQYHEVDSFPAGLGTNNGGADDITPVSHSASSATVTWVGQHFSSSGFWALNNPVAIWSRPLVTLSATTADGTEATPGQDFVAFKVTRDGNLTKALVVNLEPPSGTATSGVDYQTIPSSVTIDAGQTSKIVQVPIIDDLLAEGPETIKLSIAPSSGNVYALGQFTQTTMTIHDNPTVASVDVDVVPPGPGQTQYNLTSGFNFNVKITVKGEALDQTGLEMKVYGTTNMEDGLDVPMTPGEITGVSTPGGVLSNTGPLQPGQDWPDAPGFNLGAYSIVANTHAGTGTDGEVEGFHEDTTGFPGDTPDYYTNLVDLSRQYKILIFANGNNTTPIFEKDWSYAWTNRPSQYQSGQQPVPPTPFVAVSYNHGNTGVFSNVQGINGLAGLN